MKEVTIIGVDLAKNVFQLHGAAADGSVVFRKRLTRTQYHRFISEHPACLVAMEACPSAHYWARELTRSGHRVRLISPQYVKPYAKRQKNDVIDAEAIVEAATRPNMRFVEPKTEAQQARGVVFRIRQKHVHQRIELINALRAHLYEFGYIAPQGPQNLCRLVDVIDDEGTELPAIAREACRGLLGEIESLEQRIKSLNRQIDELSKEAETARRLQTMPGIGPVTALAIEAFAPPMESFRRGRDFAAWDWCHGRTRAEESRDSGEPRRWDSSTSGAFSWSGPWLPWSAPVAGVCPKARGWER
jgi:transposase